MRFGLRTRVEIAFGVLSIVIAAAVSIATYAFASYYLLNQREDAALTRALLDSRAVDASLAAGAVHASSQALAGKAVAQSKAQREKGDGEAAVDGAVDDEAVAQWIDCDYMTTEVAVLVSDLRFHVFSAVR